jgi:hypothetical protein
MRPRLLILLLLLVAAVALLMRFKARRVAPALDREAVAAFAAREVAALEGREAEIDRKTWAPDLLAERCGGVVVDLWNSLNRATRKLVVLRGWLVPVIPPRFATFITSSQDIRHAESAGPGGSWSDAAWSERLEGFIAAGWELDQCEFRHERFETNAAGLPARSVFYCSAHLTRDAGSERAVLRGNLGVEWAAAGPGLTPEVLRVDASGLSLTSRRGDLPFASWLNERAHPPAGSYFVDPLVIRDLDGDGTQELVLVSANLVFRCGQEGKFSSGPLRRYAPGLVFTAVMEDFDRDGSTDLLVARFEGAVLFKGSPGGTFDQPGRLVWAAQPHLKYGQALACGDVDGDGDLDVWLGQYKPPYDRGQMPTPYFDANDGNPSYLLVNDGTGQFSDVTEAAGLAAKSRRRCYAGSLVDLDHDGDLDLVRVSDFAGAEFYRNEGKGEFLEVSGEWAPVLKGFGMGHLLSDFDADGHLDFLMMGMQCPTPQRLDHAGLRRPEYASYEAMRPRMVEGNRLLRGRPDGRFEAWSLNESIRRSGWSWGCAAADLDCDGFPDLAISNGHETHASVRDYEGEFWRHDIYVGKSEDDPIALMYFQRKIAATRGQGWSYGGWEKNRLFLNRAGRQFVEAGHLLGVAVEADSRNMAAADLDGDGRPDLIVTTFEVWPERKQTLQVFRNGMRAGHWIGVRLRSGGGRSAVGAEVSVVAGSHRAVAAVITGDSYRTQHPPLAHFGLGEITRVDRLDIRWPGGARSVVEAPAIDRYHDVTVPESPRSPPVSKGN